MNFKKLTAFALVSAITFSCPSQSMGECVNSETDAVAAQTNSTALGSGLTATLCNYHDLVTQGVDIAPVHYELDQVGYVNVSSYLNVRDGVGTDGTNVIETLGRGEMVKYTDLENGWAVIEACVGYGYICTDYIVDEMPKGVVCDLPYTASHKTWMDYRKITSTSSPQYKLQQVAYTDSLGIRCVNGRYCVAVGSYFDMKIGQYFDLILENDVVIPCVLGDQKAKEDTDINNLVTEHSNCLSEFVIDKYALHTMSKRMGDMSYVDGWDSPVIQVIIYDQFAEF